jgi:diguanylate cyclase (GGDEF)-like protein
MNELERKLIESPALPSIPRVAQRLLELLEDDDAKLSELTNLISSDTALTAKIIRLINSPLYGLSREIVTLNDAVLYLGFNTVRSVALSFSFLSSFRSDPRSADILEDLWRTSLMNALAARRLASELGEWDAEEAFLAGMIAHCGVLLLQQELPEYGRILESFTAGVGDVFDLERARLTTTHDRIGGLLLEAWNFPRSLRETVGLHHDMSTARAQTPVGMRVRTLHAAWQCARTLTVEGFVGEIGELEHRVSELLGIPPVVAHDIAVELPNELRQSAACFELPADQLRSYDDLLAEANRKLSRIAIEADRTARELAEALEAGRNGFGDLQTSTTGLDAFDQETGLIDRGAFEQILEVYHLRAREIRRPIGLLILKFENFKSVSDREGYDVAVQGLRQVTERVASLSRQSDRQARLAQDQIALLLPGCSGGNLFRAAERLRFGLEQRALDTRAGPLLCQLAIGVAVANPFQDAIDPQSLMSFATSAVEQAEHDAERIVIAG